MNFTLCFPPGTELCPHSPGAFRIRTPGMELRVRNVSTGMATVLRKLVTTGGSQQDLERLASKKDGSNGLLELHFYLQHFEEQRILCHRVCASGNVLATLVPNSQRYQFLSRSIKPGKKYIFSRFTYIHRNKREWILESPLAHARIILHDRKAAEFISELNRPQHYLDLSKKISAIERQEARLFFELLWNAGVISEVDAQGRIMEEEDSALAQWEFHDLLFHSRSRAGRHSNPYGRKSEKYDADEVVRASRPPARIEYRLGPMKLYKPDLNHLLQNDIPFTRVLEARHSERKQGKRAITDRHLGEFLYRSARVCGIFKQDGFEYTKRVYPGSGAAYELELYLAIHECEGIRAGFYHYDPVDHRLFSLSEQTKAVEQLLQSAAATALTQIPQVLIIVSACFQRMTSRYQSISYAAILKDVGVLYQTFYLVATAMGLAGCALGVGNSDLFAEMRSPTSPKETTERISKPVRVGMPVRD